MPRVILLTFHDLMLNELMFNKLMFNDLTIHLLLYPHSSYSTLAALNIGRFGCGMMPMRHLRMYLLVV